jgi:hypothetical protein
MGLKLRLNLFDRPQESVADCCNDKGGVYGMRKCSEHNM